MIKHTGHIIPKTRFITAQLNAWFTDGLWLELAQKANENAIYHIKIQMNLMEKNQLKNFLKKQGVGKRIIKKYKKIACVKYKF